jgi:YidC/Oxa1 family membrane protein insertase
MEKRTLLAIALSFLVLLLWQLFFAKKPEAPLPTDEPVIEETEITADEEPPAPLPTPEPLPAQEGEEKTIEVETPLYRAVITTAGGRIVSFHLKQFDETIEDDSPPVSIIPDKLEVLYPLITFDTNIGSFEENVVYTPLTDSDNILIDGSIDDDSVPLTLYWEGENFRVEKTYTFNATDYSIDLGVTVTNLTGYDATGEMSVSIADYLDTTKKKKSFALFRSYQYPASYLVFVDDKLEKKAAMKIKPNEKQTLSGDVEWLAFDSKYFISALIVSGLSGNEVEEVRESDTLIRGTYHLDDFALPQGNSIEETMKLYLGPKESKAMDAVGYSLDEAIDYGFFEFLSIPLVMLLNFFFSIFKNYGVAIILLTIIVRMLLYPITYKSMKSMKDMQKIQPHIMEIREKYKNDKEKMNQEVMRLYQTHKINPLGGCLPLLLQLPVFIALYRALFVAIELRHSPFCLWIQDLSEMDPYYITPIVMGLSYFVQQKMTPTSADPTQQKMMMFMPVIFTIIFLNLPSGLVLYFFVSNLLSIVQQIFLNKIKKD